MRRMLVSLAIAFSAGAVTACNVEERRQCQVLSDDTEQWLVTSQEMLKTLGQSKAGLFAVLDPAVQTKSKELEVLGDSIAERWEKASPQCKQRVMSATKEQREASPILEDWTPQRLVDARERQREEEARQERERLEEERRVAEERAARERLGKALAVHLDSIIPERRSRYSVTLDYRLPVTFENTSDEAIVGASGRLKCFNNLDNLEGYFYTEQTDLQIAPGQAKTVTLVTDDIRSRWLRHAKCSRQVWEPEVIRFQSSGVVRAPLPEAPLQF